MLQISTWVKVVITLVLLAGVIFAVPNAIPSSVRDHMPNWLPKSTVSLGLDLQTPGGRELLQTLVARSDVFLTSFPQPVLERLEV